MVLISKTWEGVENRLLDSESDFLNRFEIQKIDLKFKNRFEFYFKFKNPFFFEIRGP